MFLLTSLLVIALSLTSGSACWPSDAEFQTLASKVSQPLIHPIPPATPCYDPTAGSCTDVKAGWLNGIWRSDQPGAAKHTNYETYTFPNGTIQGCYLDTTLGFPCQQGNVMFEGWTISLPLTNRMTMVGSIKQRRLPCVFNSLCSDGITELE